MGDIEAIVFDMYGTVLYEEGGYEDREKALADIASRLAGIEEEDFIAARRKTRLGSLTGRIATIEERYERMLEELGLKGKHEIAARLAYEERGLLHERVKTYPHIYGIINTLHRRGYKTGLLSNISHPWEEVAEGLGAKTYFDALVFSYRVGMVKPDPMIYLKICDLLGVEPKQVAFVGDGEDDEMEGAEKVGMTTILVQHDGAYSLSHPLNYSGLRIEGLMELLKIFPSRV
jgi:putative hydrolase of the HAD superfamily